MPNDNLSNSLLDNANSDTHTKNDTPNDTNINQSEQIKFSTDPLTQELTRNDNNIKEKLQQKNITYTTPDLAKGFDNKEGLNREVSRFRIFPLNKTLKEFFKRYF